MSPDVRLLQLFRVKDTEGHIQELQLCLASMMVARDGMNAHAA